MELRNVLRKIEGANDEEINEIISAVIHRYQICYPGWEILFLSLPKCDEKNRKKQTEEMLAFVRRWS